MLKRNYAIVGITPQIAKSWERDFRDDLRVFRNRKTGEIQTRISLTIFEAIVMRIGMIKYNLTHPCVLKLKRCNGRRYGV